MIPYSETRLRVLREVAENRFVLYEAAWCHTDASRVDRPTSHALNDLRHAGLIVCIELQRDLCAVELTEVGEEALQYWATPQGQSPSGGARQHAGWMR
jgi:hypothetical protein